MLKDISLAQEDLSKLESKIRDLESELDRNQHAVVKLRETALEMLKKQVKFASHYLISQALDFNFLPSRVLFERNPKQFVPKEKVLLIRLLHPFIKWM